MMHAPLSLITRPPSCIQDLTYSVKHSQRKGEVAVLLKGVSSFLEVRGGGSGDL